jgi:hypothetical protein
MPLSKSDKEHIQECCEAEGFSYAFIHWSDFKKVKDPKFHELRLAYVEAAKALGKYVGYEP